MDNIDRDLIALEDRIAEYRQPQNQPEQPTAMQDIERMSISVPSKMVRQIDQYRRDCDGPAGLPTRSAAVRELLDRALAAVRSAKKREQGR